MRVVLPDKLSFEHAWIVAWSRRQECGLQSGQHLCGRSQGGGGGGCLQGGTT